ncbi:MAG: rhomboid family intramembrane serine protease, partial [Saprospiraceae bacterium]|nr:rhomboid family intramembrane serine protease [Saprospiraceae bacterium]
MFFPIGDDQIRGGSYPIFSYTFLVLNVLVFLWEVSLDPVAQMAFLNQYSAIPAYIESGDHLHTLVTSMFLHGGWLHLIFNMLFLWVFADNIEATIGNVTFFCFYIMGGIIASLAHIYFNSGSEIPSLGASGAISGVLGAYLVMFPKSKVKVMLFLVIIFRRITMRAVTFLGI